MSEVTYGHDHAANGGGNDFAQYMAASAPNGAQQVQYTQGSLQQGMPPQMQQAGAGYMPGGEPSMRKTVQGIPQLHLQQQQQAAHQLQQQQQQHPGAQQQLLHGGLQMGATVPLVQHHFAMQAAAPGQAYPAGVPIEFYQAAGHPPPGVGFPHLAATHVADYRFGGPPQFVVESGWHNGPEWDEELEENGGAVLYGNLEVKHRRRTTPEQLRVLEHWFAINPRPDNALREWLASELGITKRNVQVWFQNRRAKIKNQEKAREAAAAQVKKEEAAAAAAAAASATTPTASTNSAAADDASSNKSGIRTEPGTPDEATCSSSVASQPPQPTTPTGPVHVPSTTVSLANSAQSTPVRPTSSSGPQRNTPKTLGVDMLQMGRRVSLAGGDVANVETWAKVRRQQLQTTLASPTIANSPMGAAAAARRNSQPYPTQILTHHEESSTPVNGARVSRSALPSPKVSPNGPRMPQQLLFTAMRNNTLRRASMPGGAQLISTTTFTPPRTINLHPVGSTNSMRELSPIKDQDHDAEIDPALRGADSGPGLFITPPGIDQIDQSLLQMSNNSHHLQFQLNPSSNDVPFSPNSPLPNPTFSFGGTPSGPISNDDSAHTSMSTTPVLGTLDQQNAMFMALQRGRLASLASVNSVTSNTTDATADGSDGEWPPFIPPGFDPDIRRASAPADLLHNLDLLGISSATSQAMSAASSGNGSVMGIVQRPSPLAAYSQGLDGQLSQQMSASTPTMGGGPYIPASDASPSTVTGSAAPSEGPSPSALHTHVGMLSSGGVTLMPPPPVPQRQTYTQLQQPYEAGLDGSALPNLPEPSAYTFPSEGNGSSGELSSQLLSSDFDLGFDLCNDDKDQFSFLADLSGDDTVNVLV